MQPYKFKIEHRPGVHNQNADALSRREYPANIDISQDDNEDDLPVIGSTEAGNPKFTAVTFEYADDNRNIPKVLVVKKVIDSTADDKIPNKQTLKQLQ